MEFGARRACLVPWFSQHTPDPVDYFCYNSVLKLIVVCCQLLPPAFVVVSASGQLVPSYANHLGRQPRHLVSRPISLKDRIASPSPISQPIHVVLVLALIGCL